MSNDDGAPTAAMAASNLDDHGSRDSPMDAVMDRISGLPDDILLDIFGRLVMAGDARTVARASILSRRWRSLPWPQIRTVFLDVGSFFAEPSECEWRPVRRRHRFWEQHRATAGFADALARFLAAPPSARVIETLSLKFILTRRDLVRRIGELVAGAADAGAAKSVELEVVTEMHMRSASIDDMLTMVGYGERFRDLLRHCPGAFRRVTRLTLQFLWFEDPDALGGLVRGCGALEFLSLTSCGLFLQPPPADDDDEFHPAVLAIDAPRLKTLMLDRCCVERVDLVQVPALVDFRCRWILFDAPLPVSFGCAPALTSLFLGHRPLTEDDDVKLKLSELLARDGHQIETLRCVFDNEKIWLQPEPPKALRAVSHGLCSFWKLRHAWRVLTSMSVLALLMLMLMPIIFSHICRAEWRKEGGDNANMAWQPSPHFRHYNLRKLSFQRAFNAHRDARFARLLMVLAVNLETLSFGVKSLECEDCTAALPNFPGLARSSRLGFPGNKEYADETR